MIMANSGTLVNPPPPPPPSTYSNGGNGQATANVAATAAVAAQPPQQISNTTTTSISSSNHRTQPPPPPSTAQAPPPAAAAASANAKTPSPTPPVAASTSAPPAVTTTTTTTSTTAPTSASSSASTTPAPTTSNPPRNAITNNDQRWIFSVEKIQSSPSRLDNMSAEEEANERLKAALFIHELGSKIKVNQLCVNTALIYMHRFFMIHSFKKFHPNVRIVATACLFFACKVEEQPRRLREFIDSVHAINRKPHELASHNSEEYRRYGEEIAILESCILQTLGFNVLVNHAHTVIIKTCQMIKAPRDLAEAAYLTATNSLIISNFCVKFSSEKVACFCIYLACKWTGLKIPTSSEGMQWYQYVNPNINEQELEEITKEYLAIYEQVPEKVKRKLGKTKTNDEVDNQQPAQAQQQQHLQKQKPVDLNKTAPSALHAAQKQPNPNSIHGQNQPPGPAMKKQPISTSTSSLSVSNQISTSSSMSSSSSSSSSSSNPNANHLVHSQQNKMNTYNTHPNNHYPPQQQHSQVKPQSIGQQQQQHMKPGAPPSHNIAYKSGQQQQQPRSNSNHHLSFNGADDEPRAKMSQYNSNSMSNLSSMAASGASAAVVKKPAPPASQQQQSANGNGAAANLKLPGASQQSPVKSAALNAASSMKRGNDELNSMSSVPNKMPKYVNDAKTTS